jgi:cytochrome P450
VTIPERHPVLVVVTAANRDTRIAPDAPHEWRPDLRRFRSIGWGRGQHACIGEYMALMADAIGTAAVMDATSSLELARWRSRSLLVTFIDAANVTYHKAA